jgi:hypothetical protein
MTVRRVRLDEDSEKQGLLALREKRRAGTAQAYDIYEQLDLGLGGYALAPSTDTRRSVQEVLRRRRR